jgi:hypothetical protein
MRYFRVQLRTGSSLHKSQGTNKNNPEIIIESFRVRYLSISEIGSLANFAIGGQRRFLRLGQSFSCDGCRLCRRERDYNCSKKRHTEHRLFQRHRFRWRHFRLHAQHARASCSLQSRRCRCETAAREQTPTSTRPAITTTSCLFFENCTISFVCNPHKDKPFGFQAAEISQLHLSEL